MARILVYGAGPLGSLFAARLYRAGHDVRLLARGQRLENLRAHGVVLHDVLTGETSSTPVPLVETLAPEDAYDLVLVIMRKNRVGDVLPVLAANRHTPNVAFLMNNAAGPDAFIEALGAERVIVGFPTSGGYFEGDVVHTLTGSARKPATVPIGEVDGEVRPRTREVARLIESAPGFRVEIRRDMDAWLKTHVALLMPSIAPALYAARTDRLRLARTRDLLVLAVRAIREGLRVVDACGIPITPRKLRVLAYLPEPVLVGMFRRLVLREESQTALAGHANAARDEMKHLCDEFAVLIRRSGVPTPAIDQLRSYLDPATPGFPDGSRAIPLRWVG